jgi:ADP-ribose pyrophosphatase YjhB (NUDIX family)
VSAKAVVVVNGRLLLLKRRDAEGDWHSLPGGGQMHGETVAEAIQRECLMQTGAGWVDLADLPTCRMYPKPVARILAKGVPEGGAVYLGDVN